MYACATGRSRSSNPHYLKGSVACGHCGELLGVEIVRNGSGVQYPYFYCLGRQKRRTNCEFRAVPIHLLEQAAARHRRTVTVSQPHRDAIRSSVMSHIDTVMPERDRRVRAADRLVAQLKNDRDLLLRAHYVGAVPIDLREEQDRIASELAVAEREVSSRRLSREQLVQALDRAVGLLVRRTRAVQAEHCPGTPPNEPGPLRAAVCLRRRDRRLCALWAVRTAASPDLTLQLKAEEGTRPRDSIGTLTSTNATKSKNLPPEPQVVGSNFPTLVAGTVCGCRTYA
jgi:site-specific DNA recombinase